jgi:hypothetical protein
MCEVKGLGFESYTLHILHINNRVFVSLNPKYIFIFLN